MILQDSKVLPRVSKFCVCSSLREKERLSLVSEKMPRLTIPQRLWVCIEYGRAKNVTEVF